MFRSALGGCPYHCRSARKALSSAGRQYGRGDDERQEAAEATKTTLQKNDYLSLTGSGTWAILLFSLGVFWTLVQSATSGRKRDLERKEAARLEKVAARKR